MKRLSKKIQQIIKKKTFSFDDINDLSDSHYSGGLKITYRIQRIGTEHESWSKESPNDNICSGVYINIMVSGLVETHDGWSNKVLKPIREVARHDKFGMCWDSLWGSQQHKKIRRRIRQVVRDQITNYIKLFGIGMSDTHYNGRVEIRLIGWD